jgi:hypothetical protein
MTQSLDIEQLFTDEVITLDSITAWVRSQQGYSLNSDQYLNIIESLKETPAPEMYEPVAFSEELLEGVEAPKGISGGELFKFYLIKILERLHLESEPN